VIDLCHHLPAERADERNEAVGPSRAQAPKRRRGPPDASSPGEAALVALVQLLARQAAEQHISQGYTT
jgi:hypothetical protein